MSGRYAIFVDAAFLWASAGEVLYGTADRSRLTCHYESLLEALTDRTDRHSDRELLRVYWYDGAVNKVPTPDQRRLALIPDVKLRLGRLVAGHQKGVDTLIVADLLRLAGTGMVDTLYLLSGDDDLTEVVREAQAGGIRLVLVGAATGGPRHSESLMMESDGVELWPREFWAPHFSLVGAGNGPAGRAGPTGAGGRAPSMLSQSPAAGTGTGGTSGAGTLPGSGRGAAPSAPPEAVRTFERVGFAFARRWLTEVGADQHERLRRSRPRIPADIDARLLWDTSAGRDLSEGERVALRDGFWRALDEHGRSGPGGSGDDDPDGGDVAIDEDDVEDVEDVEDEDFYDDEDDEEGGDDEGDDDGDGRGGS